MEHPSPSNYTESEMIRYEPKTSQPWLTPTEPGTFVRRYGPSVRAYSVSEMDVMVRGDGLPSRYRNVGGLDSAARAVMNECMVALSGDAGEVGGRAEVVRSSWYIQEYSWS